MQESKDIDYAKQHHTPHCWLPAKVMYPANSTKRFSWLTRSTSILLMKNVQIYGECIGQYSEQSSANNPSFDVTLRGRLFMWHKKSRVHRTVVDTPESTEHGLEQLFSTWSRLQSYQGHLYTSTENH